MYMTSWNHILSYLVNEQICDFPTQKPWLFDGLIAKIEYKVSKKKTQPTLGKARGKLTTMQKLLKDILSTVILNTSQVLNTGIPMNLLSKPIWKRCIFRNKKSFLSALKNPLGSFL